MPNPPWHEADEFLQNTTPQAKASRARSSKLRVHSKCSQAVDARRK